MERQQYKKKFIESIEFIEFIELVGFIEIKDGHFSKLNKHNGL